MTAKDGIIEVALALIVDADGDCECYCDKVVTHGNVEDALSAVVDGVNERFDDNVGGSSAARRVIKGIVRLPVPTNTAQAFTITLQAQKPDEGATVELS